MGCGPAAVKTHMIACPADPALVKTHIMRDPASPADPAGAFCIVNGMRVAQNNPKPMQILRSRCGSVCPAIRYTQIDLKPW